MRALEAELREGAGALGLSLRDDQFGQCLDYLDLLLKWNGVYNLTAIRDPATMLTHHVLDSLAVIPALTRERGAEGYRVLDVGAGAGLPGVILAIVLPGLQIQCVDAVAKKARFIQQAALSLKLPNLTGTHARVEALKGPPFEVVTSRAFASLADFVSLTRGSLAADGVWLAMKGKAPDDEIAVLPPDVEVFHVERLVVPGLGAERHLVWMRRR